MGYEQLTLTTDAAGNGTAVTNTYVEGEIMYVSVDYDAGAAVGTDLVVAQAIPNIPILTLTNNNVDGIWAPRAACVDNAAAGIFYDAGGAPANQVRARVYVCGPVTFTMAQAGGATTNTVTIYWKDHPSD